MERIERLAAPALIALLSGCTMVGATGAGSGFTATPSARPVSSSPSTGGLRADDVPDVELRDEFPSPTGNMERYEQSGRTYRVLDTSQGYSERGVASWYGEQFHGRNTSSGERFDMYQLTAAHRTLPIPSFVRVTNLANGRSVVLRVNDRGPFADPDDRIIDVSYAAAIRLDMVGTGTANVRVDAIAPWQWRVRGQ